MSATGRRPLPEVRLSATSRPFLHWLPKVYDGDIFDLNAPYQRGSVWSLEQRQALIKSLYMGVPVGSIIVSKLPYRKGSPFSYRIVDGKQRIEAVRAWAGDAFAVPGWWFDSEYIDLPGDEVRWSHLSIVGRRRFETGTQLPGLEFDPELVWLGRKPDGSPHWGRRNDAQILVAEAELYALVNGGGTPQTDGDMARAAAVAGGAAS